MKHHKIYFDIAALNMDDQFSYEYGDASCTYNCLEASIYMLHGKINPKEARKIANDTVVDIIRRGIIVARDHVKDGYRSCDEVYEKIPRFQEQLILGDTVVHRLFKEGAHERLLEEVKEEGDKRKKTVVFVVTKPPDTILLCYHPDDNYGYKYTIFDSHRRYYFNVINGKRNNYDGSGFYFFLTDEGVLSHLKQLYGIKEKPEKVDEFQIRKYYMLEANHIYLREGVKFIDALKFEKKRIISGLKINPFFQSKREREIKYSPITPVEGLEGKKEEKKEKKEEEEFSKEKFMEMKRENEFLKKEVEKYKQLSGKLEEEVLVLRQNLGEMFGK